MPGSAAVERQVTLSIGERRRIEIAPSSPPRSEPPSLPSPKPERAPAPSGPSALTWILGGVGLTGVAVGSVAGALMFGKKADIDQHCHGTVCDPVGQSAVESGRTLGWIATIGWAVGIAGIGSAIVLYLTRPSTSPSAGVGLSWVQRTPVLEID